MMKRVFSILFVSIFAIGGCKKIFLTENFISSLTYPETQNNLVTYYHKHFTITGDGRLFERTHSVLKIGDNLKAAPQLFYVFDGSVEKLIDFDAKIIGGNGAVKTYRKGDLLIQSLSDRRRISEIEVRFLPIMQSITAGDIIETVSTHELKLPPLGIRFSPSEIGEQAVNISCSIEMPLQDSLSFKIVNDNLLPKLSFLEKSKIYHFEWDTFSPQSQRNRFNKRNSAPEILATFPRFKNSVSKQLVSITNWKDFGNWYLDLIAPKAVKNEMIVGLAKEITKGKITAKEKMDAIFEYCQKNIRYEQVYLEKGEIIPNDYQTILARKYGDCKDYSLLMYVLAKSIGVNPNLALCYRGRGIEFYDDITVSQFNHAIVYLNDNGNDYWYDGTNRIGIPGITTIDLMNATALILEKNNSRLLTIAESPDNKLQIEGSFKYKNKGLVGDIKISLFSQFAIDFFYEEMYLNKPDMVNFLLKWMKLNINNDMIIQGISYQKKDQCFVIDAACEMPNTFLEIESSLYSSLARIFNRLFPEVDQKFNSDQIFYFPYYNQIGINLVFTNLYEPEDEKSLGTNQNFKLKYDYALPAGPFDQNQKSDFLNNLKSVSNELNKNFKLLRKENVL